MAKTIRINNSETTVSASKRLISSAKQDKHSWKKDQHHRKLVSTTVSEKMIIGIITRIKEL